MSNESQAKLSGLTAEEINSVAGGNIKPVTTEIPQAQDKYGNTMSHEEWMDWKITHGGFDFYEPGFDPTKPNIWHDTGR